MEHDYGIAERAGELHHVELYAADLEAAVGFWDWLLGELGYEPKNDWDAGRSWIRGPTYVVVKAANDDGPVDRETPGLDHLAFHAGSRAQVDRITDRVRERDDTALLYGDRHPYAGGYYAVYFEDSVGITVEVVGPDADGRTD